MARVPMPVKGWDDCRAHLQDAGYFAEDRCTWHAHFLRGPIYPQLQLQVTGHEERDGHTFYTIDCALIVGDGSPATWKTACRLKEIREEWFERISVKNAKGDYNELAPAMFPPRGGVPGTTALLNNWVKSIAEGINRGDAMPYIVALTLCFLKARLVDMSLSHFLMQFGYPGVDANSWCKMSLTSEWPWPTLEIEILAREELQGHTCYMIESTITPPQRPGSDKWAAGGELRSLVWMTPRRLKHIREDWYLQLNRDTVWPEYAEYISEPFASRGGLAGTTKALNTWMGAVAKAINMRLVPPSLVALSLHFLDIPAPLFSPPSKAPPTWTDGGSLRSTGPKFEGCEQELPVPSSVVGAASDKDLESGEVPRHEEEHRHEEPSHNNEEFSVSLQVGAVERSLLTSPEDATCFTVEESPPDVCDDFDSFGDQMQSPSLGVGNGHIFSGVTSSHAVGGLFIAADVAGTGSASKVLPAIVEL